MLILLTNDDGIHSTGLRVLQKAVEKLGEVYVVAPDRERSAISHALTLHTPLRVDRIAPRRFAVDGTPSDCVNLALHSLLPQKPDLLISGINKGGNMGEDISYSGTVAAAFEGMLRNVPAIALSQVAESYDEQSFADAAEFLPRLINKVLNKGIPEETLLNINIPPTTPKGVKITRQGKRVYDNAVVANTDPRGKKYYWIGGAAPGFNDIEGTDLSAIHNGYISITPLHLDLTNYKALPNLYEWEY